MSRYVLALKDEGAERGLSTQVVREFPGFELVGQPDPEIVTVEAKARDVTAFLKKHGDDFLVEKSTPRMVPVVPPSVGKLRD